MGSAVGGPVSTSEPYMHKFLSIVSRNDFTVSEIVKKLKHKLHAVTTITFEMTSWLYWIPINKI